jgi:hypothetical protein
MPKDALPNLGFGNDFAYARHIDLCPSWERLFKNKGGVQAVLCVASDAA